jgi:hypothetical protein
MRKSSGRPEDAIQRAIFQHFKARKAPGKPIEAAIMKGLGVTAGVPDIIAIRGGHAYGLELKADGGMPSQKQIEAMAAMEQAGATVALAIGLDAAITQLEGWGLLKGRAA